MGEAAGRSADESGGLGAAEPEIFPEAMKVIGILREREAGERVKTYGEHIILSLITRKKGV